MEAGDPRRGEDRDTVLRVAAQVEGHPDTAACVHGGVVAVSPGGRVWALEVHPFLRALLAVPAVALPTSLAREALGSPVPTGTGARTVAQFVFLLEGLRRADAALLAEAGGDELHEERRAAGVASSSTIPGWPPIPPSAGACGTVR